MYRLATRPACISIRVLRGRTRWRRRQCHWWYGSAGAAFANESNLEKNATDPRLGQMFFAGIVFVNSFPDPRSLPKNITYKIRPKAEPYNKSSSGVDEKTRFSWFTNIMYPSRSRPREPKKTRFGGIPPGTHIRSSHFLFPHLFSLFSSLIILSLSFAIFSLAPHSLLLHGRFSVRRSFSACVAWSSFAIK